MCTEWKAVRDIRDYEIVNSSGELIASGAVLENAQVLAAAPDLMAGCRALVAWHEAWCDISKTAYAQVKAAIAKAEGR